MSDLNRINTQQNFTNPNFLNFSSFIQPINSNPVYNYIYNMNLNRIFPSPINLNQIHNFNNNIIPLNVHNELENGNKIKTNININTNNNIISNNIINNNINNNQINFNPNQNNNNNNNNMNFNPNLNINNNITKNNQSLQILKLLEGLSKTNSKKTLS